MNIDFSSFLKNLIIIYYYTRRQKEDDNKKIVKTNTMCKLWCITSVRSPGYWFCCFANLSHWTAFKGQSASLNPVANLNKEVTLFEVIVYRQKASVNATATAEVWETVSVDEPWSFKGAAKALLTVSVLWITQQRASNSRRPSGCWNTLHFKSLMLCVLVMDPLYCHVTQLDLEWLYDTFYIFFSSKKPRLHTYWTVCYGHVL